MGDLVKTMSNAVHRQMLEGQGAHFRVRGLAVPIDPFMTGAIRTAKKIEYQLPLIAPDNMYKLNSDAVFDDDRIEVNRESDWIQPGGYVTIGERELHEVEDIVDTTLIFSTRLLADHPADTPVYHYSNPVVVEGAYAATQTVINIDTPYFVVRGDVLGISPDANLYISFVEYRITALSYVGVGPNGLHQYQVTLDRGLHRALEDEEIIQLRAYPAYVSTVLPIPQAPAAELPVVGPYLVDWLSAPFLNRLEVDEYQTLLRYNDARLPIGAPTSVEKNHQILHVPIRADQMLWWTKVNGFMKYDGGAHKMLAITDSDGYWRLQYTCVPTMEVPSTNASGLIVTVSVAQLLNNEGFRLVDDVDGITFEYKVDATYVATASAAATAQLQAIGFPVDNNTVILDDGFGTIVTFEFQRTNGFTPAATTNRVVDVRTALNFTDVAIALEQAVNAVAALQITSVNTGALLDLTNDNISQLGNTTIVVSGAAININSQFGGGTDRVVTIDVSSVSTPLEVAQLTASAISGTDLHVTAVYPTIAASVRLISTVDGPDGNQSITETVLDPGFVVQGMSGGTGGTTWNLRVEPVTDILLRVRLYPNDFQDYSLVGGSINTVAVNLDPTDEPIERIELLVHGAAGTEVRFGDWGITGARVSALQHTYVAHVQGERNYASTGLMVKPLFHSKEDLQVEFDNGETFDSGGVMI